MGSSENLNLNLNMEEGWRLRPTTFGDSWISEAFARDTETVLTKALQKSLSHNHQSHDHETILSHVEVVEEEEEEEEEANIISQPSFLNQYQLTPSLSACSSDVETINTITKRQNTMIPVATKTNNKRKSRASKRTTTTFIMADPCNFRQMVQQVTGVRLSNSNMSMSMSSSSSVSPLLLKPQPHRPPLHHRFQGCLPTLDTSAFLLDHNHHHAPVGPTQAPMPSLITGPPPPPPPPPPVLSDRAAAFDFDTFSSFPTLESWKVM